MELALTRSPAGSPAEGVRGVSTDAPDLPDLSSLDAAGVLAAGAKAVRARRLAEVADLEVLIQWAVLHGADPTQGPDGAHAQRLGNVLVALGGEGTPGVQDFCLGEIALARGTGVTATSNAIADVLDLAHRLPATWAACRTGSAEVWVARRVAKLSRHLPAVVVGVVDAAVARVITGEAGGRVLAVAEAAIIAADPEGHAARVEEAERRRFVGFGRTDVHGLRTVIARVRAGDAVWVKATLDRLVEILTPLHPHAHTDEIRAIGFGYLARPAELLTLLLEHSHDDPADRADSADADEEPVEPCRALALPTDLLDALRTADWSALAPKAVLYVHLHQAAILSRTGVARVEDLGPFTLQSLQELLGRTQLSIKPVIDLADRVRTIAYEHPAALKERVYLTTGGDYWPYAVSTSRHLDYDHPTPFHDTGPPDDPDQPSAAPGQTGTHNSGPLGRRHHRWKTHAGYRSRQAGPGRYAWLTPHGLGFLVDHTGTHPIDADHARMIIEAPPGLDLYLNTVPLEIDWTPDAGPASITAHADEPCADTTRRAANGG